MKISDKQDIWAVTPEKGSVNTPPPLSQVDMCYSNIFLNTSLRSFLPFFSQINQHSCTFVTDRLPGLQNHPPLSLEP